MNVITGLTTIQTKGTGHNGDKSRMATTKTATSQNGDTKTATTVVKTATTRVKTATIISQNGDKHWSKRRNFLVKTATVIGQNGDSRSTSQATAKKCGRSKRRH